MRNIPKTTLFLLQSLDGKISTGDNDTLDVDKDFPKIPGVKEGLHQYYDLEKRTDFVSFNSGRVQEKIGANNRTWDKDRSVVSFVMVDNKPHLNKKGIEYFAKRSHEFFLITTNKNHPAFKMQSDYPTMHILFYEDKVNFSDAFGRLRNEFGIKRMTVQTGGTINAELLRRSLIDEVSIIIAPILIGGTNTQSLIGGESLHSEKELMKVRPLELIENKTLENSYIHLRYKVLNEMEIFLVPYDPKWISKYEREKELLQKTIGKFVTGGIHHVGSTAIPGLSAKPIVDILVGVESLVGSKPSIEILKTIDYQYSPYKEEYEHWFCKPNPEHREFHLHLMPTDSTEFKAKIAFRDYLLSHPEEVKRYEDLKTHLAEEFSDNREAYTEAKTEFVKEIVRKALGPDFRFET